STDCPVTRGPCSTGTMMQPFAGVANGEDRVCPVLLSEPLQLPYTRPVGAIPNSMSLGVPFSVQLGPPRQPIPGSTLSDSAALVAEIAGAKKDPAIGTSPDLSMR